MANREDVFESLDDLRHAGLEDKKILEEVLRALTVNEAIDALDFISRMHMGCLTSSENEFSDFAHGKTLSG